MSFDAIAKIAVENTVFSFDKEFSYIIPKTLSEACKPGVRVLVPFGRGNRKRQGIITTISEQSADGLKSIIRVIDSEPVLTDDMLKIAFFLKEHYFCTLYEAVKTMLPAGINYRVTTVYGANVLSPSQEDSFDEEKRTIYDYLLSRRKPVKAENLLDVFGFSDVSIFENMVDDGILYKSDEAFRKVNDAVTKMIAVNPDVDTASLKLTPKQSEVLDLIAMTGGVSVKEVRYFTGVSPSVID